MKPISRYFFFLTLVLLSNEILAGPWNKDKKHGYFQFAHTYLRYGKLLNGGDTKIDLKRDISDLTYQFYGEYGLSKKWNLIFNVPYKVVSSADELNDVENDPNIEDTLESGRLSGFSNLGLAVRYNISEGKHVWTAQVSFQNNNHMYDDPTGLQIGYDAYIISPSILYGRGWNKYYLQAQAGVMFNSGEYATNGFGNLEIGRSFWGGKSYLVFRTDIKLPIVEGTRNERNSVQTGLFRDNSSFISPGGKWIQKLGDHIYLNLAVYGAIYSEREGNQATFNIGLAYDW